MSSSTLDALLAGRELSSAEMRQLMESFVSGQCDDVTMAALLIALRAKGETANEIATAAQVLREHMIRLDTGSTAVLDTCGTGGDSSGTFNISTATAFVVAGAGVPVLKHGNRAISSRSGSADVLAALGVEVREDPQWPKRCLDQAGLGFCFAPYFHPALKHVGGVRRKLGVRTIFNCLGPLVHPACASRQLLGVGRPEWLDLLAGALAKLGTERAILVSGSDGLDEVTLSGPTQIREVSQGQIKTKEWNPVDFGLESCSMEELRVESPDQSAEVIRDILQGKEGPAMRIVLANSAACLVVMDLANDLKEGVALARESVQSQRAAKVLSALIGCE